MFVNQALKDNVHIVEDATEYLALVAASTFFTVMNGSGMRQGAITAPGLNHSGDLYSGLEPL